MKMAVAVLTAALLHSASAEAYDLNPGAGSGGAITGLTAGVKELGFESMLVVGYDKVADTTDLRATFVGGGTFRYFMAKNLALALNVSFLYKKAGGEEDTSDVAGLGTLSGAYYASLGGGLFIRPLVGIGGFYGKRDADVRIDPEAAPVLVRSSLTGFTGRGGLALVFYASHRFNLLAGPEVLASFGKATPTDGGEGRSFTSIDAGFNVGMSYVF